ncbi:DUF320 domain-containing protein [Cellulomonas sp. PS-H5]|uniref:DUF320 domain-containing protein n=1 Tax=Cellulomonas sp. PS-H5 TaxID=2820400 RepID=UPI001C4E49DC|nr:DUF320 domain-containing protein [Cellulomonas sp. PS-H5]MBW0256205.1 DUF320 domain-containing protein [Cellulomonas sp. PS-H5]
MRRAVHTALLTGGLVVAGAVSAYAADDDGLLSGLGIEAPVDVSVDVTGLAAGVLGDATTTTTAPAAAAPAAPAAPAPTASVGGGSTDGVASGTAVAAPVSVPVDVSTVAVGVLGDASATAPATTPAAPAAAPTATVEGGDADGIASGTGVAAPISVPVDVDGVALGVLGDATTSSTGTEGTTDAPTAEVGGGDSDAPLAGTGIAAPIDVPVTVGDVALGLLGDASTTSTGTGPEGTTGAPTAEAGTGDSDGLGSGTAVAAPISIPITLGDIALSLLGDATTSSTGTGTQGTTDAPAAEVGGGDSDAPLAGTGAAAPINVPVTVGDIALGLLGDASTTSTGTGPEGTPGAPTAEAGTGDSDGIASGTAVAAPISIPITVGDVALGLLGDAATTSTGTSGTGTDAPTAEVGGGDSDGLLTGIGIALPISVPVSIGDVALGVVGEAAIVEPGTGTGTGTDPGTTEPGTTDPGTTEPGTTDPGTTDPGTTGTATGTDDGTTAVADVAFSSEVLAAADLAAALDRSAATAVTVPAALAPTGAPAALTVLAALGLVGLGLLLRRIPRVVLT